MAQSPIRESPLTTSLILFAEFCCILFISTPSSPYRRLLFFPFALLVAFQFKYTDIQGGVPQQSAAVGLRLIHLLLEVFDYVFVTDAPRQIRSVGDKTDLATASALSRLTWAFKLHYNPRCIGWSHEETSHLPHQPTHPTRSAFLISRFRLWLCYLLLNFGSYWDMLWRMHLGVGMLLAVVTGIEMQIMCVGMIWVALGFSDYKLWPHAFGSFKDAYTVRRLWGKTWHQIFRRTFMTPTNFIARVVGLPRTGIFQRYFKILLVFTFSGIMHQAHDSVVSGGWTKPTTIFYFMAYAPMIMVEDGVIDLGRRLGIKNSPFTQQLGYLYVLGWVSFIAPLWAKSQVPSGIFRYRMDFSVIDGLWRGNWRPYSQDYL
ncbi:membrane bound O-acyl transferase family-domain-containing protein [Panaeolus papilionaceus]|nr:membrane bound O-acyl transferase family-domain-containing protein [Panaeolus papilionaceus]